MNLYQKIALMASVAALTVAVAVGACVSSRSADGQDRPEAEQIETESFRQNNSQTPENADPAADGDDIKYEPNDITDDETLNLPPFAEDEEETEFLPSIRPGYLRPAIDDLDEDLSAVSTGSSTDVSEIPVPEVPDVPENEEIPEISPEPPAASPITEPKPETTKQTTEQTTPKVPETSSTPEVAIPEVTIPEGTDLRSAIVAIAKSQIGVKESHYNNVIYNTWFYGHTVSESRPSATKYAWCAVFLSWCADQAGVPQNVFPKTASVTGLKAFFAGQSSYHKRSDYTPKVGDVAFFGTSHVGIVVSVEDGIVTLVEGNYSDSVALTTYKLSSSKITGYGSPKY